MRTPLRLVDGNCLPISAAKRVPSGDSAIIPAAPVNARSSVQSSVLQIRTVIGLAVMNVLPSGENSAEPTPLNEKPPGRFPGGPGGRGTRIAVAPGHRLVTSDLARTFQMLNFSPCPTTRNSPLSEKVIECTGPSCFGN